MAKFVSRKRSDNVNHDIACTPESSRQKQIAHGQPEEAMKTDELVSSFQQVEVLHLRLVGRMTRPCDYHRIPPLLSQVQAVRRACTRDRFSIPTLDGSKSDATLQQCDY